MFIAFKLDSLRT